MIVQEIIGDSVRTYSDAGFLIHGGFPDGDYAEAVDPIDMHREYTETDIPIEEEEEPTVEDKAEAYDILVGASE